MSAAKKYFGLIYRVVNKVNDKVYIGQTTGSLKDRKQSHISDSLAKRDNFNFHKAIRKYGKNNFVWKTMKYCYSKEELDETEVHYIKKYNSKTPGGYNMTCGRSC